MKKTLIVSILISIFGLAATWWGIWVSLSLKHLYPIPVWVLSGIALVFTIKTMCLTKEILDGITE